MNNYDVERQAVQHVMKHLISKGEEPVKQPNGSGADIICGDKYIDVKGCLREATNLRMCEQVLNKLKKDGNLKQGSFFIYYVFGIASGNPKLMIFDYDTFEKHKIEEKSGSYSQHRLRRRQVNPILLTYQNSNVNNLSHLY